MSVLAKPIPFGDYYLLEKINSGGMAEVFKAKTFGVEGFERLVAVKKILPAIAEDKEFISMFVDEAKIAVQLTHANIVQIFKLGNIHDEYYIAMEYVPGRDLRAIYDRCVRTNQKLSIGCVCYIVSKICEGLDYAHNKKDAKGNPMNIIHRDISPQNILIGYEGDCKLIDFGIAKAANKSTATQVGILKGKFSYMSPEQVAGKPGIDRRSDIFALGIVLFEMLTLKRLFLGSSDFETLEKIRKVEVSPPTLYNSDIPEELEDIVLKALEKDVALRYQTANELQEAIQRFMFKQNIYYTAKDLSEFMHSMFAKEITDEQKKAEFYKTLTPSILAGSDAAEPAEDETKAYDKAGMHTTGKQFEVVTPTQSAPKQALYDELDDFQPPDSIVYSSKSKKPDEFSDIINAPVTSGKSHAVARKSAATLPPVVVNKGHDTMLVESVSRKGPNKVLIAIVALLTLLTIGLVGVVVFKLVQENNGETAGGAEVQNTQTAPEPEPEPAGPETVIKVHVEIDGATVLCDGKKIEGDRDFVIKPDMPGDYFISVSKEGYKTWEQSVTIENQPRRVVPILEPAVVALVLKTDTNESKPFRLTNQHTGESVTGTATPEGYRIPDLPVDDQYTIAILDGSNAAGITWKPRQPSKPNEEQVRVISADSLGGTVPAAADANKDVKGIDADARKPADSTKKDTKTEGRSGSSNRKDTKTDSTKTETKPAETPKTETKPVADVAPNLVMFNSKPPAEHVYVSGKGYNNQDIGGVPTKLELPPGTYTIRFVNEKNALNATKTITVKGGGEKQKVMWP